MPSPNEISISTFSRLVGLPGSPVLVDVRIDEDYNADSRLIPGSVRRDFKLVSSWAKEFTGRSVVVT